MANYGLYNDHFQNYKSYQIPRAQLVIADIPYNVGANAYGSNPMWYVGGDNKNGESELAGKEFFDTDKDFRIMEFMHFCNRMLIKEPKESGKSRHCGQSLRLCQSGCGNGVRKPRAPKFCPLRRKSFVETTLQLGFCRQGGA